MILDEEFRSHLSEADKQLFLSTPRRFQGKSDSAARNLTPDDVDREMSFGKSSTILKIDGMTQQSLEHFAAHYGSTYRCLYFIRSQSIQGFSPLENLKNLEAVVIDWNIRADKLWNLSKNPSLRTLLILDCKKITRNPDLLRTSPSLKKVGFLSSTIEFKSDNSRTPHVPHHCPSL